MLCVYIVIGGYVVLVVLGIGIVYCVVEWLFEFDIFVGMFDFGQVFKLGVVGVFQGLLCDGVIIFGVNLVVIIEIDLIGSWVSVVEGKWLVVKWCNIVDLLVLMVGDLVVYDQYGIGWFVEMVECMVGGVCWEYLVLEYVLVKRGGGVKNIDKFYVLMDLLDQLLWYVGGQVLVLSWLGGSDWVNIKIKVCCVVCEIVGELVLLYVKWQVSFGYVFLLDMLWQVELEDVFGFIEIVDQFIVIEEVKVDMEKLILMDWVICGDVGYGKIEIVVWVVFKVV